jgi:hypothetical protein
VGFTWHPMMTSPFQVNSANGWEGKLSADAFGIAVCLFAYSHLSFAEGDFGELCARHYHWLREYVMGHAEAAGVLAAID